MKNKRRARRLGASGFGLVITSYASIAGVAGRLLFLAGILLVLAAAGFAIASMLKPPAGRHRTPATEKAADV